MSYPSQPRPSISRRGFLRAASSAAASLALAERVLADPYGRPVRAVKAVGPPTRIRGRVHAGGKGVPNVGLTDGFATVTTDRDGRYTLIADSRAGFVSVRIPSGFRLPTHETGTARLHQRIERERRGEAEATFALEPLEGDDTRHAFLLLADPQTQNAMEMGRLHAETVPDARRTLQGIGERHVFGVACGDIMYDNLSFYPDYERAVSDIGIPFLQVVGNHDLDLASRTEEASVATFQSRFGPGHYSFDRGEIHYVVLDDVFWYGTGYVGYLDGDQLAWLAGDLALVEAGRTVVVFLHIPLASTRPARSGQRDATPREMVNNREALYRLLEPFRAHVLAGHTHEQEHLFEGGIHEHVHGTVCGAWWSGDICWDGTPNGYCVYEVTGSELRWRYKATGQPDEYQLRVYPPGTDPSAPGDLIANVWGWDPEWTVVWYHGADPRGPLSRRVGLDPMSVKLHTGPELPPRRTWVEPTPTAHLFYAAVPPDAHEIRVEARDRWGGTYAGTYMK